MRQGHRPVAGSAAVRPAITSRRFENARLSEAGGPSPFRSYWREDSIAILRICAGSLRCRHADLRILLREMRQGQRSSGAFQRLVGHKMSALWLAQTGQEVFSVRLRRGRRRLGTFLHREAPFLRHVRHRTSAFALNRQSRSKFHAVFAGSHDLTRARFGSTKKISSRTTCAPARRKSPSASLPAPTSAMICSLLISSFTRM